MEHLKHSPEYFDKLRQIADVGARAAEQAPVEQGDGNASRTR